MTLTHQFRQAAAAAAGAVVGMAAAMALAAPANANTGLLTAAAPCTDTGWNATWTLKTTDTDGHDGVLSNVKVDLGYQILPPGGGMHGGPSLARFYHGATVAGDTTVTDTLVLNPFVTSATLTFTLAWQVGGDIHTKNLSAEAEAPTDCNWRPEPLPSKLTHVSDCASLTITLANPVPGREVVTRLKPSTGQERVLAAMPGETKTEKFAATAGFTVDITQDGIELPPDGKPATVSYEQPNGCVTDDEDTTSVGSAGKGGGDGGTLPVTGADAATAAIAAGVMFVSGVVLFVMARRRKMKFTA